LAKLNLKPEELAKIRELTNSKKAEKYLFLGYSVDLDTTELWDLFSIDGTVSQNDIYVLSVILSHYSSATPKPKTERLIKFKDLPGGLAYEVAFLQRGVQPVAQAFGSDPSAFLDAGKLLGGKSLTHGDASVEIPALEGILIVYILWTAGEFSASANLLFDESASAYLSTEGLAVLTELTTARLIKAYQTCISAPIHYPG